MPPKIILTGAPGTGKTSVLRALAKLGYACVDEPARHILAEQRALGPFDPGGRDRDLFVRLMLSRAIHSYDVARGSAPIFYDRGVPDYIAYALHFGLDLAPYRKAAERYRYHHTVYMTPPWREIFANDEERTLSFEATCEFSETLRSVYEDLGCTLVQLPLAPVATRVELLTQDLSRP